MNREDWVSELTQVESACEEYLLTEDEKSLLVESMNRGLRQEGRNEFTDGDLESGLKWVSGVRILWTLLEAVLGGEINMMPSPDGDPRKVKFIGNNKATH